MVSGRVQRHHPRQAWTVQAAHGALAPHLARLACQPAEAAARDGGERDRATRVRYGGRLWHLDSAGPNGARRAAALPHLLRDRRQCHRGRDRSAGGRRPPGAWLAGLLVATGRWRAMGRGQPLCLPGFGNDRDRVRLGSPALRRAGSRLRNPLRPDCHRPRGRPGRDSSDRQLPGQLRRLRCPGRSASSAGNRDRTRSVGRPPWRAACRGQRLRGLRGGVTSCLRTGPQNRR